MEMEMNSLRLQSRGQKIKNPEKMPCFDRDFVKQTQLLTQYKLLLTFLLFSLICGSSVNFAIAEEPKESDSPVEVKVNGSSDLEDSGFGNVGAAGQFAGSLRLLQILAGKDEEIYSLAKDFYGQLQKMQAEQLTKISSVQELQDSWTPEEISKCVDLVKKYILDFEESTGQLLLNVENSSRSQQVSWNPLASYRLLRRISVQLKSLLNQMPENSSFFKNVTRILGDSNSGSWPSENLDVSSALEAIIRIQLVYNLTASDLSRGVIYGRDTKVGLTAHDCFTLGNFTLEAECCYETAVGWFKMAREKMKISKNAPEKNSQQFSADHEFHEKLNNQLLKARAQVAKEKDENFESRPEGTREVFYTLCSGQNLQKPKEAKSLFCWHETRGALSIAPVKSELLSLNPRIIQYYDLLTQGTIDLIKTEAAPSLARSLVFEDQTDQAPYSGKAVSYRTSLNTWIPDVELDRFRKIPALIEQITGLSVNRREAAEYLQIASYGFGGHYQLHYDEVQDPADIVGGGRIATFMFYLTDVEAGGFTAFPHARVAARPIKGSAVFWQNLYNTGLLDERTEHGACPTILGEKWVANKWILYHPQWTRRKCSLKAD